MQRNSPRPFLYSLLFLFAGCSQGASFDCSKATSVVEKSICSSADLSRLDSELSQVYKAGLQDLFNLREDQQEWLTKRRNTCADNTCIKTRYIERISEIRKSQHCGYLQRSFDGRWTLEEGDFFQQISFFPAADGKYFDSWRNGRPEMSGEVKFSECKVIFQAAQGEFTLQLLPTKVTRNQIVAREVDSQSTYKWRRQ